MADNAEYFLLNKEWVRKLFDFVAHVAIAGSIIFSYKKVTAGLIFSVIILIVATVFRFYIDFKKGKQSDDPKERTMREILRFLTTQLLGEDSKYRTTILVPDDEGKYIYPKYRYQYGQFPRGWMSNAKFERGIALAGMAWADLHKPISRNIPELETDDDFIKHYQTDFQMPEELVTFLSPHMRKVRSIFCYGLVSHDDNFTGVLSIDCTEKDVFTIIEEEKLNQLIVVLEAMLEDV